MATNVAAEETDAPKKDFTMDGELGVIFTTGNTETTSVKGRISANQELEMWTNDYLLEALYQQDKEDNELGESVTKTTAQRFFLSAQGNYKLENPKNRLFAFASYEDNRFGAFAYQATIAGGWNSQWFKTENSRLNYSIGPGYAFAEEQDGKDVSGFIIRAAMDYQWKISDTSTFKQIVSTEIGANNTKSKSETSITAKINGSLSMKASLLLNHNTDVADGRENLDTETAVTLVYTFF